MLPGYNLGIKKQALKKRGPVRYTVTPSSLFMRNVGSCKVFSVVNISVPECEPLKHMCPYTPFADTSGHARYLISTVSPAGEEWKSP